MVSDRAQLIARLRSRAFAAVRAGDLATANACECAALASRRRFMGMLIPPGGTPLTLWTNRARVVARDLKGARVRLVGLDDAIEGVRAHPYFLSASEALRRIED